MDQSTAFMTLKYRLGLGTEAARTLMDRATAETVAFGATARLYCYPGKSGQPRFDLVGVTR